MPLTKENKHQVMREFQTHGTDCGSSEVQVAVLTARITSLNEHLKAHGKDHHSRLGLLKMVSQRKRLLDYIRQAGPERYQRLIERLGIRR